MAALCDDVIARTALTDALKKMFDMERLIGRIVYGTANCRDLRALSSAIACLPEIREQAALFGQSLLREITGNIDLLEDVHDLIEASIVDDPPVLLREGGLIRTGYNAEIDSLRDLASGGKGQIAAIEQREREKTGISKLKIGYNRVFGYYIEVSKSNIDAVPEHYIRKQTLANGRALYHRGAQSARKHGARRAGAADDAGIRDLYRGAGPGCRRGSPRAENRAGSRDAGRAVRAGGCGL